MRKQRPVGHLIYNPFSKEVEGFESLVELALDMRWSWNHATDKVWSQLDSLLWEVTRNPWACKAHPADQPGQALIQEWIRFARRPEARPHVIFLGDYDTEQYYFTAQVSAARPPSDYTARVRPYCDGVAVPLEATRILWQQ